MWSRISGVGGRYCGPEGGNHDPQHDWLADSLQRTLPTPQKSKSAADVWKAMLVGWMWVFGPVHVLLVDGGQEFVGEGFASQAERAGILLEVANADAPWERGRTGRAGGMSKDM